MTHHETRALTLAREIVRLLDLHIATDGAQGCEDVRDALAVCADMGDDLAETLIAADRRASDGMTDDCELDALWAAWRVRLIDTPPDAVPFEDGYSSGLIYWSGFGSERAIRRAVAS